MKNIRLISKAFLRIGLIGLILLLLAFFLLRSKPDSQTPTALQLNQVNTIANPEIKATDKTTEVQVKNNDYQISFSQDSQNPTSAETRYSRLANGIKEEIILAKAPAAPFIAKYTATLSGVKPRFFKDLWHFFDDSGREQFFIPKPFMVDQKGQKSESINLQISPISAGRYQITLTPDHSWLTSTDRTYPVIVDPSIEVPEQPIQELLDKRNQNSKTYSLSNGRIAWEGTTGPIHYKDNPNNSEEPWKEIDTEIQPVTDLNSDYGFQNVTNNFKSYFKKNSTNPATVKYENNGHYITFTNQDNELGQLKSVEGSAQNNQFIYPEAYDNVDIKYSIDTSVLLEEFVLKKPRDVSRISQKVHFEDAYYQEQKDGSIKFFSTKTNELVWTFPKPKMYELNEREDENFGLHYEITKEGDDYIVTKVLDQEGKDWLNSPERIYPLVIDTTLDAQVGAGTDDARREYGGSPGWSTTDTYCPAGVLNAPNTDHSCYMRWTNITIANSATINVAYITLTATAGGNSGTAITIVKMQNADDAATFSTEADATGRSWTTGVSWTPDTWSTDVEYNSPSIVSDVQTVVNRAGWASGNDMAALWDDNGSSYDAYNRRHAYSYNQSTTKAPKLHIEYTTSIRFNGLKMEGIKVQ